MSLKKDKKYKKDREYWPRKARGFGRAKRGGLCAKRGFWPREARVLAARNAGVWPRKANNNIIKICLNEKIKRIKGVEETK